MSTIFTWSIKSIHNDSSIDSHPNFVISVLWKCEGTQDGDTVAIESTTAFAPEPSDSFIPFNQLTEAKVLEWIFSSLDKEVIEGSVVQQLKQRKNQTVKEAALPW